MKIPFSPPYIDEDIIEEVVSALNSGWITTGPKVKALEKAIAEYTGISDIVCVNSWTSGAIMILKWLGIKEGDEVIVPAYTYSATALAVLQCGGKPVMVDVNDDLLISVDHIRSAITPRTKAIIPVDIAGWPCDYDSIKQMVCESPIVSMFVPESEIQRRLGRIMIIADAAHSFGALQNGRPSVHTADISIFSLHAVKNITTAEGGAICINMPYPFNNHEVSTVFQMMSLNGQTKDAYTKNKAGGWRYDILIPGLKINMPDVCAAIGLAQLRKYPMLIAERKRIFNLYSELFERHEIFQLPPQDNTNQSSSYHLYALRINGISEKQRDSIIEEIAGKGVAVNVHFIPMPMMTLFKNMGYKISDYPKSYDNFSREISLPIYPQLPNDQIEYIAKAVISSCRNILSTDV